MEKIKTPRLLVVGGSGFIGQHVVRRGISMGWEVISLGRNAPDASMVSRGVRNIAADLTQACSLRQLGNNHFDYVVNLGGYINHTSFASGGRALIESHFDGLLNLLEFLDRTAIRRFVQIGSSDEYGDAPAPQSEELRECPISPYSLAKVAATHFLQMLQRTEAFPSVVLRLFLTYGPGQNVQRFLPQIINGCLQGLTFPTSKGEQLRDFCYVEDTVDAIFLALASDSVDGEVINVGSGTPVTIRSLIDLVHSIVGKGRPEFGLVKYRSNENMELVADTKKIQEKLKWRPEVSLEVGLRRTIDSIRNAHAS